MPGSSLILGYIIEHALWDTSYLDLFTDLSSDSSFCFFHLYACEELQEVRLQ